MSEQERSPGDPDEQVEAAGIDTPIPGRAERDPDEGPGLGGGSALDAEDPAADEEVGGGD